MDPISVALLCALGTALLVAGSLIRRRSRRTFERRHGLLRRHESGRVGWALLWLLGVPIPLLLVLYLLRGCT